MLGDPRKSGGVLWDTEAVSFAAVQNGLEGGAFLVVLSWIFQLAPVWLHALCVQ